VDAQFADSLPNRFGIAGGAVGEPEKQIEGELVRKNLTA